MQAVSHDAVTQPRDAWSTKRSSLKSQVEGLMSFRGVEVRVLSPTP